MFDLISSNLRPARYPRRHQAVLSGLLQNEPNELLRVPGIEIRQQTSSFRCHSLRLAGKPCGFQMIPRSTN